MFHKTLEAAEPGDAVGCLLRGIEREDVERGQVLAKPGSIKPHTDFSGEVYVLSKEEGGRHTPFFNGYRPQFYIRTTDVTGDVTLPEGVEMVMPGDNVRINVQLIQPVALEDGVRFAIREGGRTVGAGVVTKLMEYGGLTVGQEGTNRAGAGRRPPPRRPRSRPSPPRPLRLRGGRRLAAPLLHGHHQRAAQGGLAQPPGSDAPHNGSGHRFGAPRRPPRRHRHRLR